MDMNTIKVNFKYTQREYVKAFREYLFASKIMTKTSVIVGAVFLPFSILNFFFSSYSLFSGVLLTIALFFLVMGCILYFYNPVHIFKKTAKYHEEYHLTFSDDGIRFQTPSIQSELKWDNYNEFWESKDCYYLIQAVRIYSLIPKRVFPDAASMQAFEDIAVSNLDCTKRRI